MTEMWGKEHPMERRDVLKTAGGIGAVSVAGGAGLLAMTGGAAADSHGDYESATVTSDDGTVEYVAIYGDKRIEWEGFDSMATQFSVLTEGRVAGEMANYIELNDTGPVSLSEDWGGSDEETSGPGTSGHIENAVGLNGGNHDPTIDWHVVGSDPDNYGLPENSIDPSILTVDDDGGSYTFTVQVKSTYTWYDSGGNEIFSEDFVDNVRVEVNNRPANAEASDGDGEDGAVAA